MPLNILNFLKKILVRHPDSRYSAKEALNDAVFSREIYDEGSKILSLRMQNLKRPQM